jgi:eukaryotic-like serine/threonine-protein kinase
MWAWKRPAGIGDLLDEDRYIRAMTETRAVRRGEQFGPTMRYSAGTEILGRYRLERLLGLGGMGEVWAALHLTTQQRVALKVLKAEGGHEGREATVRRFFREAEAIRTVSHPNVVALHSLFMLDDSPVMVMDLLEGEPLARKLEREGRIEVGELARILLPVISAVGTAHARGIVHRDLKPDNVFLSISVDGVVPKVLDFGIAKLSLAAANLAQAESLTSTGAVLGTPYYMAPEQVWGENVLDARSDVWAMGVIMYRCLSGVRPFYGRNPGQIFKSIVNHSQAPLKRLMPVLPQAVSDLVQRMLEKDVTKRCPDLCEAFEVLAGYANVTAPAFGPPLAADAALPNPPDPVRILDSSLEETTAVTQGGYAANSTLSGLLTDRSDEADVVPEPTARKRDSNVALVIDDDDIARELIVSVLQEGGYETFDLPSPIGATQIILERGVGVVVVDLLMPAISGDKLVKMLRSNPRLNGLFVMLVSSCDLAQLHGAAASSKADAVVPKADIRTKLLPQLSRARRVAT